MLYHREVFWKDWFDESAYELTRGNLVFTKHMESHIDDNPDRSHCISHNGLIASIKRVKGCYIPPFEVEVENGVVVRMALLSLVLGVDL